LRVVQLGLLRQSNSTPALVEFAREKLAPHYPANSWPLNRELSRILIYTRAPQVIPRTLDLIDAASTHEQQLHYVAQLRHLQSGWTLDERRRYLRWWNRPRDPQRHPPELFRWFADVNRLYVDVAGVDNYLRDFRRDALKALSSEERAGLAPLLEAPVVPAQLVPATARAFVREWTMADFATELTDDTRPRNFQRGRQAFADAQCLSCHRFGNDGGAVGPELTAAGSKYTRRDLLESILEPSKVISDQYANKTVTLVEGDLVTGKIISENDDLLVVETDAFSRTQEKIPRKNIRQIKPAALSPMPEGLANMLNREEILDLLAYLQSGGRPESELFRKRGGAE